MRTPPPEFSIDVRDDGALVVLELAGELDMATAPRVHHAVERHGAGREEIVVDLRELTFMDSTGLALLIALHGRRDGAPVSFVAPDDRVGRVLGIAGVREIFRWVSPPGGS